jgi:hypothetical protein
MPPFLCDIFSRAKSASQGIFSSNNLPSALSLVATLYVRALQSAARAFFSSTDSKFAIYIQHSSLAMVLQKHQQ